MEGKKDLNEKIDILLSEAYLSEDEQRIREIAEELIDKAPENPEVLVLMADSVNEDEKKVEYLEKALEIAEALLPDNYQKMGSELMDDDSGMLYVGILQRLGFVLFSEMDTQRALELAREIMKYDLEDETFSRTLFYRCMLDMGNYEDILRNIEKESVLNPAVRYSRAIALYKLYGASLQACEALWDIFRNSPDIPFYLIGYWQEPDGIDMEAMENYNFSIFFEDPWSREEELLLWLGRASVLFGYFTERLSKEAEGNIDNLLKELDMDEDLEMYGPEIKRALEDTDPLDIHERDIIVCELLASRECSRFSH